jgi:hypothetical protein
MWILDGWRRVTGMPQSEQGVALALSVSGRAAPIAQSIAHDTLQQPWGLSYLIWRLEQCFGREEQDLQRSRFDNIKRLHRRKGESAKDFLIRFELTLWEGEKSGASYSPTIKAHMLLTAAGLSHSDERWVTQCLGGDLSKYEELKSALRRLNFHEDHHRSHHDHRSHRAFYQDDGDMSEQTPTTEIYDIMDWPSSIPTQSETADQNWSYDLTSENPSWQEDPNNMQWYGSQDGDQSVYYDAEEDWDEIEDDYVSLRSDEDESMDILVLESFAATMRFRKNQRKGKGAGKQKGKSGKNRSTRNLMTDVPPGWGPAKWQARHPCPSCGSRWHRDCSKRKGSGNSKGKGKYGKGTHTSGSSSTSGASTSSAMFGKSRGKGKKGKSQMFSSNIMNWGVFFATLASSTAVATSAFISQTVNSVAGAFMVGNGG